MLLAFFDNAYSALIMGDGGGGGDSNSSTTTYCIMLAVGLVTAIMAFKFRPSRRLSSAAASSSPASKKMMESKTTSSSNHKTHATTTITTSRSKWRHALGELLESELVLQTILVLIVTDVACSVLRLVVEHYHDGDGNDSDNGGGGGGGGSSGVVRSLVMNTIDAETLEMANTVSFCCLLVFLVEQILHLVAFGWHFFHHPWYVADLVVVSTCIMLELHEEQLLHYVVASAKGSSSSGGDVALTTANVLRLMRLWRLFVAIFDFFLGDHVADEIKEAREEKEHEEKEEEAAAAAAAAAKKGKEAKNKKVNDQAKEKESKKEK